MLIAVASAQSGAGKTALVVALAQLLAERGSSPRIVRLEGDDSANDDAVTLAAIAPGSGRPESPSSLHSSEGLMLAELSAGQDPPAGATVIGVVRCGPGLSSDLSQLAKRFGPALAGVVLTFVPQKDIEGIERLASETGVRLLGLLPEDRLLASPILADIVTALEARTFAGAGQGQRVLDRIYISSISADPNQEYVVRLSPNALIVRSDKPDQQLAALYAGVPCLIISGTMPLLSYVLERAEEDDTPLLLTALSTQDAAGRVERLYGRTRFAGPEKAKRSREVIEDRGLLDTLLAVR